MYLNVLCYVYLLQLLRKSFGTSRGSIGGMIVKAINGLGEAVVRTHYDLEIECVLERGGRVNSKQEQQRRMYSQWLKACQPPPFPNFSTAPLEMA